MKKQIFAKVSDLVGNFAYFIAVLIKNSMYGIHKTLWEEKAISYFITSAFIFMFIFETFFPLGDFMRNWFGLLGTISGQILGIAGFVSLFYTSYHLLPESIKEELKGEDE